MTTTAGEGEPANLPERREPSRGRTSIPSSEPVPSKEPTTAEPAEDPGERAIARRKLELLRPLVAPGALFRVRDGDGGLTAKLRPMMVVGPVPKLEFAPEVALKQPIRMCSRTSDPDHVFARPLTEYETLELIDKHGVVFTPAGIVKGFTLDGFFELWRRVAVPLERLDPAKFLGWLPHPAVERIMMKLTGRSIPAPYPPSKK